MVLQHEQHLYSRKESLETIEVMLALSDDTETSKLQDEALYSKSQYHYQRRSTPQSNTSSIRYPEHSPNPKHLPWGQCIVVHPLFRTSFDIKDQVKKSNHTSSQYLGFQGHVTMTLTERIFELTKTNGFLLQKLAYHKDAEVKDLRFGKSVAEFCGSIKDTLEGFNDVKEQAQTKHYPVFLKRKKSGRAGNITPRDHQIIKHGGTTSTYEELPHRLQLSKKRPQITLSERELELTQMNRHLLTELKYHQEIRVIEMRFHEKVIKLHIEAETILKELIEIQEERLKTRGSATSVLMNYWGISSKDDIKDSIF